MKLPIRRVPNTVPPQFEYYNTVNRLSGGTQAQLCRDCVPSSMEQAMCDLLRIAEQLAEENQRLKKQVQDGSDGRRKETVSTGR